MLELPPALTKNFGLGPRSFTANTGPKPQQDKSWTRAPTDSSSSSSAAAGNDADESQGDGDQVNFLLPFNASVSETYFSSN